MKPTQPPTQSQPKPFQLPTEFAGLEIKQPEELEQYRGWSCGLSGPGGVGKTTLSGTLVNSKWVQEHGKILYVDIEGGAYVIDDEPPQTARLQEGPILGVVEASSWTHIEMVMQQLHRNPDPFVGAVWDNMSEALELCKHKHHFYETPTDHRIGLWDGITNDMVNLFRQGRDLARTREFIIIYNMWDTQEHENPMGEKFKHRGLHFNPKLSEKFLGITDMAGWLETPPKPMPPYPAILHFDKDPLYPTKTRVSPRMRRHTNIPDTIYSPDLGDIVDTIIGGKPWPSEKHQKLTALQIRQQQH